jgi:cation:H+ antiporter
MPVIWWSVLLVVLGLVFLLGGGELLLRGAVGLAEQLRLTPAIIGLTVVAAGTSVPELAISGIAAARGSADIAVANVVGSNIFNIAVIIGLCALLRPVAIGGNTIRLEYPVLVLVTLLSLALAQDGSINRIDASLCIATYVAFTAYSVGLVREQLTATETRTLQSEVKELSAARKHRTWHVSGALVLGGILLLVAGANIAIGGAVGIARWLGWSERVIGLTIISAGSGLPEVVASTVSSIRGRSDIAIGNVIGSNLFNLLGVLGLTATVAPLTVDRSLLSSDFWWMLGMTVVLFPLMVTGRRVSRGEGGGLLFLYVVYLTLLLRTAGG